MHLTLRGHEGRIKAGYRTAARVATYALTPTDPATWSVSADLADVDTYWVTQAPLALEIVVGKQRWSWRDTSLTVADRTVTGTVRGRPERR